MAHPSGAAGGEAAAGPRRDLIPIADLLVEQRRRITEFTEVGPWNSVPPSLPYTGPPLPSAPPPPGPQEVLDAVPVPALLVTPETGADGRVRGYWCAEWNEAARQYADTVIPSTALPPWPGHPVPLFPDMAGTAVPRMLDEARRTGAPQGPVHVEFFLRAPDGEVARVNVDARTSRCGEHLLLAWERGNRGALARAAQRLARTCWAEWNITGQPPRGSLGVRHVLGLSADAPVPDLMELAALTDRPGAQAFYQVLYDVLLRERTAECDLALTTLRPRIMHFLAEPVRLHGGPVWAVRGVMIDVTRDRRSRERARHAEREALRQRHRAQALEDVADTLREAVVPRFAGETDLAGLEAAAVYRPDSGAGVGGDWFKARVLPGGLTLLALGDARGHGLAAVTLMAKLRFALGGLAYTLEPVEALTGWLNDVACDDGRESTATAIVARYHPRRSLLRWTCAGHLRPLLLRAGRVRPLDPPPGLPLGVLPAQPYAAAETPLTRDDIVLMYSDGLVERRGSDLDTDTALLGHEAERLASTGVAPGHDGLQAYAEDVVAAMTGPHRTDDATLLALRCLGS